MPNYFSAQQSSLVELKGTWAQVQEFLREPHNLTVALLDQGQVRQLDREHFEVRMRPIGALGLQFRPVVKLRIQTPERGEVRLQAIGCQIEGNDWLNDHFDLQFEGRLYPLRIETGSASPQVTLRGTAHLNVWVGLPPLLALTPKPLIDTVGNTIVQGVLMTIRVSLSRHLPRSFLTYLRSRDYSPQSALESMTRSVASPHPLSPQGSES